MVARISHTSVDARDAYAQSVFWAAVLGCVRDTDDPNCPGDEECLVLTPDGTRRLLFIAVPEGKQVKNRIHFDLQPVDGTRDDEPARLLGLGAVTVDGPPPWSPGVRWPSAARGPGTPWSAAAAGCRRPPTAGRSPRSPRRR